eukprot:gene10681-10840_t
MRVSGSSERADLEAQVQAELSSMQQAVAATPADPITKPGEGLGVFSPGFKALGEIGQLVAGSRVDVLHGNLEEAARKLEAALQKDGSLGYVEPPRQTQPIRHCLGWVLMQQGKLKEAEQMYLTDLAELPGNAWSLRGLQQVYQAQGAPAAQLQQVGDALAKAWAHADPGLKLNSSCPAFSE